MKVALSWWKMQSSPFQKESTTFGRDFGGKASAWPTLPEAGSLSQASQLDLHDKVSCAIKKIQSRYISEQRSEGYWWYELESNVTMTSEYLMLLHFLGLKDNDRDRKMVSHILKRQRPDGTWSLHWGGEGDLSTTAEAYFALKLAGHQQDDPRLKDAREFILQQGGLENTRVFTKIFLALFGEYDWRGIPSVPVEINLIPSWFPFNVYSFSSWARATFVPLSVVLDRKPVRPQSAGVSELYKSSGSIPRAVNPGSSALSWKRFFAALDGLLKMVEDSPLRVLRDKALSSARGWIIDHQEPTGDWGGIQPAMVNSILALAALDYDMSHEPVGKGLEALRRFGIETEEEIFLQSCISPVWDTALTSVALRWSGTPKEHPALEKAGRWLASKQILEKGDWSNKRPEVKPGGWAFEFDNSRYPDVDDSCVVLMFLSEYADSGTAQASALERGLGWILGMQGRDGGWAAFDADNNMHILNQLPFGDLEAMIDPSTADITGRVLQLLGQIGYTVKDPVVRKAIKFLRRTQEKDGSWWGRWGVNYLYGTSCALSGLDAVGDDMSSAYVRKAVQWLMKHQNMDGGWGECCESYGNPALKCRGASTPSQTAWAILALISAGKGTSAEVVKGIDYLLRNQNDDGTWNEECYTGTGFPKYFMLKYHNYRNCFPLMALGKFQSLLKKQGRGR